MKTMTSKSEYLKKYMSLDSATDGDSDKKKKKKKKVKKAQVAGLKIIDDDADTKVSNDQFDEDK